MSTMTQEDLLKVCQLLARKYRSNQELDDLISEGYLAGLESVQQGHPKGKHLHHCQEGHARLLQHQAQARHYTYLRGRSKHGECHC